MSPLLRKPTSARFLVTSLVVSVGAERVCRREDGRRGNDHPPSAVNLRAEVDLEVLGVVKDVQESAALVKLGDAEETVQKSQQVRPQRALFSGMLAL